MAVAILNIDSIYERYDFHPVCTQLELHIDIEEFRDVKLVSIAYKKSIWPRAYFIEFWGVPIIFICLPPFRPVSYTHLTLPTKRIV